MADPGNPNPPHEEESDEEDENAQYQQVFQNLLRSMVFNPRRATSIEGLVKALKDQRVLQSEAIERAMLAIPRGLFVTQDLADEAYIDQPIRVATMGFNISAPHMYAMCLEKLCLEPGLSFLDIGSGCGLFTAIGGYLVGPTGQSHGLEVRKDIIEFSEANLKKLRELTQIDLPQVKFFLRNCFLPDSEERKYDRIHVGACCPETRLKDLYALLNPRGILITPCGDKLIKCTKDLQGNVKVEPISSVRYGDLVIPSELEVKAAQLAVESKRAMTVTVPPNDLTTDLLRLVNCDEFSDIAFIVEGKRVPAHKFILVARSAHFRAMFTTGMRESKESEITIPNCSLPTFLLILRFLYAGDVAAVNEVNAVEVLEAANYFKCDRLKAVCEDILHRHLDVESAASLLQIADRFDARQLKSCCLEFTIKNFSEVSKTPGFAELDRDLMIYITQEAVKRLAQTQATIQ
jgi:protein-L-isoaspartate(D-aspartate) O-methyltransferase